MPAGTDLITWNPRVGSTGDDRYAWPESIPFYIGTPKASFANPDKPTITEVNAAEGWNQVIAETARRMPTVEEQTSPNIWPPIFPMPLAEEQIISIPVGGRTPWWTGGNTVMDPHVIARDISSNWGVSEFTSLARPNTPGNSAFAVSTYTTLIISEEGRTEPTPAPSFPAEVKLTRGLIMTLRKRLSIDHLAIRNLHYYRSRTRLSGVANTVNRPALSTLARQGVTYPPSGTPFASTPLVYVVVTALGQTVSSPASGSIYRTQRWWFPVMIPGGSPSFNSGQIDFVAFTANPARAYIEVYDSGTYEDYSETGIPSVPPPWLLGSLIGRIDTSTYFPVGGGFVVTIPLSNVSGFSPVSSTRRTLVFATSQDSAGIPPTYRVDETIPMFIPVTVGVTSRYITFRLYT